MGHSTITMAIAQPKQAKPAGKATANASAQPQKTAKVQMHRRSRTGASPPLRAR
jgi:hypothetical protein